MISLIALKNFENVVIDEDVGYSLKIRNLSTYKEIKALLA